VHDVELVRTAFHLVEEGATMKAAAADLGIGYRTVRRWIRSGSLLEALSTPMRAGRGHCDHIGSCYLVDGVDPVAYSYLLGLYLGDGHIVMMRKGVFKLQIYCCDLYPGLIRECESAIAAVVPTCRVNRAQREGCTVVYAYSKHWPCLFPQTGLGHKHERPITLTDWQRRTALKGHPRQLIRGLLHSDGCRVINRVHRRLRDTTKTYEYVRYFLSNHSRDILELFIAACNTEGIDARYNNWHSVSVARRASVARLDTFVGPKW
jgi:hypothetical protein